MRPLPKYLNLPVENLSWPPFFLVISGKNRFDNGGIYDNFELPFFARKIYQYGSTVSQKMQNYNIFSLVGGVSFLSKVHFVNIFMRRSLRLKWSYNLISKTLNISRLHLFVYCGPILIYFSGQKLDFQNFIFPPF